MYLIERLFLVSSLTVVILSLLFIPKEKRAQTTFILSLTQFFTWILGLIVVENNWLEYPVREFSRANGTSFSFEYFSLPVLTSFFVLYYPHQQSFSKKLFYNLAFPTALTIIEYFVEKYTLILKYITWNCFWSWLSFLILFHLIMAIYKWFFKVNNSKPI